MSVEFDDVTCARGDAVLFEGLSFALAAGEALLVRGSNGSGKTSLLRMVPGYIRPTAGTVRIEGEEPNDRADLVHFAGHGDGLKADQSAQAHLRHWAALLGGTSDDIEETLSTWGLARIADLPCGVLSAGQRRRLALARLTLVPRPIWVLDEPTAPLDRTAAKVFIDQVADHRSEGGIVIVATHMELAIGNAQNVTLGGASS